MKLLRRTCWVDEGVEKPLGYCFYCPGCRCYHAVHVEGHNASTGARWGFNGNLEAPTFTPSILVNPQLPSGTKGRCHSFVTDGRIQFLGDSGHDLAGQTVAMVDVDAAFDGE